MAAPTVAAPFSRRTGVRLLVRLISVVLFLVFISLCVLAIWFYRSAHASLAQIDGAIAVQGLSAPVQVVRDAHGVPHLTAANLEDLFFAQGYVTAQDRLWQMDMTRRAVAGEMAEILPPASAPQPAASRSTAAAAAASLMGGL